jgi:hypothetical protein
LLVVGIGGSVCGSVGVGCPSGGDGGGSVGGESLGVRVFVVGVVVGGTGGLGFCVLSFVVGVCWLFRSGLVWFGSTVAGCVVRVGAVGVGGCLSGDRHSSRAAVKARLRVWVTVQAKVIPPGRVGGCVVAVCVLLCVCCRLMVWGRMGSWFVW